MKNLALAVFKVVLAIALCTVGVFVLFFLRGAAKGREFFRSYFDMPIDRLKGLKVSGMELQLGPGHERYFRFAYDGEVGLRNSAEFTPGCDLDSKTEDFLKQFPKDRLNLVGKENLICRSRAKKYGPNSFLEEFYLVNNRTKVHFFHSSYVD